MKSHRVIALSVFGLSLVGMGVSGYALAKRIQAWHEANPRQFHYFSERTDDTQLRVEDRLITIEENINDQGEGSLEIAYAPIVSAQDAAIDGESPEEVPLEERTGEPTATLLLPVAIPNENNFPGLDRHMDWFQIFFVASTDSGVGFPEFKRAIDAGEVEARCVAVCRYPNPGIAEDGRFELAIDDNAWGYGEVLRDRWTFQFHEFMPDGTIRSESLKWPESGQSFYRRQIKAEKEGLEPPVRDENEIVEGSWQYDAALRLVPRAPAITHENQALRNAGWTLPVASFFVLTAMLSAAIAAAPSRIQTPRPE